MVAKTKALIVGLDGATFKLLRPWISKGKLPFLKHLIEHGSYGELKVYYPTLSPLEWTCFYTGVNPGKLGIFAIYQMEDPKLFISGQSRILSRIVIKVPSLWRILSSYGVKVGVVNIPATYPPEKVNGFLISSILTPSENAIYYYPPSLGKFLKVNNYKIDLGFLMGELPDKIIDKRQLLKEQIIITKKRADISIKLIKMFKPSFFAINFKGVDNIQHLFWRNKDIILKYISFVEKQAKRIYDLFKPTYTIILSDHGFHEAEEKYFHINTFLLKKKLLFIKKNIKARLYPFIMEFAKKIAGKFIWVRELIPEELKWKTIREDLSNYIDFKKSIAYASMWGIYISKDLEKRKYQTIKQRLKSELEKLIDPQTGEKVLKLIIEREKLYEGDIEKFPDLILVPNPKYMVNPSLSVSIFDIRIDKPYLEGAHKADPYGILIIHGENIKENYKIRNARIIDLTPTILYLYNLPIPSWIDGKPLLHIFKGKRKAKYIEGYLLKKTINLITKIQYVKEILKKTQEGNSF